MADPFERTTIKPPQIAHAIKTYVHAGFNFPADMQVYVETAHDGLGELAIRIYDPFVESSFRYTVALDADPQQVLFVARNCARHAMVSRMSHLMNAISLTQILDE